MITLRAAIGQAIRRRRAVLEWTQAQLAERCGTLRTTIAIIESGERQTHERLDDIAHATGSEYSQLIAEAEEIRYRTK